MEVTDKKDFSILMTLCFQNFKTNLDKGLVDIWFDKLVGFKFFNVRMAFESYMSENEKGAPTLAIIIRLAKQSAGEHRTQLRDERKDKCYVDNCFAADIEPCIYDPEVTVCREHMDEMIGNLEPDSPKVPVIVSYKFHEDERLKLGLKGLQYVKLKDPETFRAIERLRGVQTFESARQRIIRALGDFYDTPLSEDERKKILDEMRAVAREGAERLKCTVTA